MDINMRAAHQFNHWVSSFVVLNDIYRRVVLADAKQVFYRDWLISSRKFQKMTRITFT